MPVEWQEDPIHHPNDQITELVANDSDCGLVRPWVNE
jgi:hypothetical protein